MDDIGQILYERVKKDFNDIQSKKENSDYIQKILDKVDNKTATMREVETFSQALGSKLSSLLRDNIKLEDMPDGKVYYNIADKILTPLLRENYELVNEIAGRVQRKLDEEQGIHIEPQKAPFPAERVNSIVNAVSAAETQEQLNRRLTSPVENVTESFYTDYIKENAKFRSKAGLKCYIVRDTGGGCCEWCSAIAGKYEYPGDVPEDVYRRHDNCTCSVTYYSGKTAQDVWNKTTWNTSKSERAELKAKEQKILQSQEPTSEQLEVMKNIKADTGARVDNSGESGIIKSIDIDDFKLMATSGGRKIDIEAINVIASTIKKYENSGVFYINDFYFGSLTSESCGRPLLQIEPVADRILRLNVNTDIFEGRSLKELNKMLLSTNFNLAQNLEEAVIHECGHAKSLYGKTIAQVKDFYSEIADAKISGISKIAFNDGAEALAEIEILKFRGAYIPPQAMNFYDKYMR